MILLNCLKKVQTPTISFAKNTVNKVKGFTLIEVMITVSIIGILAAVVYPSYSEFIWRSNRTEAQRELLRLANLQEQVFVDQRAYTSDLKDLGIAVSSDYEIPRDSAKKLYKITAEAKVGTRTFTLTAKAMGVQLKDETACQTLTVNQSGQKTPKTGCWE